jgi:signal transduction histidine kinase
MGAGRPSRAPVAGAAMLAVVGALAVLTGRVGLAWIGSPFPGFFLLRNGVVASISLPDWPAAAHREIFQATLLAVDDEPVRSTAEVYARVAARPVGTRFVYDFERGGVRFSRAIPSQRFGWRDGLLVFGAYLVNGLVFALLGVGVWMRQPMRTAPTALLALGLCAAVYALTAVDLYGPHAFFRLHALAECLLPAVFLHLGLVFPVRRVAARTAIVASYVPAAALALAYQRWLDEPAGYRVVHAVATAGVVFGLGVVLANAVASYISAPSDLVRHRVRVVVLGVLAAFTAPVFVLAASTLEGGQVPVNVVGFTTGVFPLAVAYAVHKRDLFAIDALVERGIYYTTVSGVVAVAYVAAAAVGTQVLGLSARDWSPPFALGFTLVAVLLLPAARDGLQRLVDRVFGRRPYDVEQALATASAALGSTLDLEAIVRVIAEQPAAVLQLERVAVFLRGPEGFTEAAWAPSGAAGGVAAVAADAPLASLLARGEILVRGALPEEGAAEHAASVRLLDALGAELVVPLTWQGTLTGFLVCGRKLAGVSFAARDAAYLRTFANQAALALQNARSFHDLAELNRELEARVRERTAELAGSRNRLVAAEKMAAFGRLAAGIAHEMNTPLGAALNALKVARDLVAECEALAAETGATDAGLRAALGELGAVVGSVEEWTRKALAYIGGVKAHVRGRRGDPEPFELRELLEHGLQPLVMHRLRLAGGALAFRLAPDLPPLRGDRGRLGQVLANLITNALDAAEGLPPERQRIEVEATHEDGAVVIAVRDHGVGVAPEVRPRLFEEFFTTKPMGRGTGLGLAIAREIVTGEFGGTITCTATGPEGTTFTLRLPVTARTGPAVAAA